MKRIKFPPPNFPPPIGISCSKSKKNSAENLQQLQATVINNINDIMKENHVILNDYKKSKRYIYFFLIISLILNISLCGYFFSFSNFDNLPTQTDINYIRTRTELDTSVRRWRDLVDRNNHGGHASHIMTYLIYGDIQTIKELLIHGIPSASKVEGFKLFDQYINSKSYLKSSIEKFDFTINWVDVFMKSELYNQAIIKNNKLESKINSSNILFINTLYQWLYTDEGNEFIKNGNIILPDKTIISQEITDRAYQLFKSVKEKYNKHSSTKIPIREMHSYNPEYDYLELKEYEYSQGQQKFYLTLNENNVYKDLNILYNEKGNIINFPYINGFDKEKHDKFWCNIN